MRVQVAVAALLLTAPVVPGAQALQRLAGSHTDFPLELRRAGEVASRAERLSRNVAALTGAQLARGRRDVAQQEESPEFRETFRV
jgi:hypothetical protein